MINVLLPVYNEEKRITYGVEKTVEFMDSLGLPDGYRVTILDNASTDRTAEMAKGFAERFPAVSYMRIEQKGVGAAFREGIGANDCDIVGYMDIDLTTDVTHLKDVLDIFESRPDVRMVNASRWNRDSKTVGRKWYRYITSYGLVFILKLSLHLKGSDAICGFKFFRKDAAEELLAMSDPAENGWFLLIEMLIRAERNGFNIYELPVRYTDDGGSRVKVFALIKKYLSNISALRKKLKAEDKARKGQR